MLESKIVTVFGSSRPKEGDAGYAELCGVLQRLDVRDELARIAAPTLVIAGAQDPSTPPEPHAQLMQRLTVGLLEMGDRA